MGRVEITQRDRRTDAESDYRMEVRFSYRQDGVLRFGVGQTLDLTRASVRFVTDSPPPRGSEVELRIAWPYLLQNVCPLELVVRGATVSTGERGTVVALDDYEFRTCGQRSFDQPAPAIAAGSSFLA